MSNLDFTLKERVALQKASKTIQQRVSAALRRSVSLNTIYLALDEADNPTTPLRKVIIAHAEAVVAG